MKLEARKRPPFIIQNLLKMNARTETKQNRINFITFVGCTHNLELKFEMRHFQFES